MQPLTMTAPAQNPDERPPERPAAPRGRWVWRVSGILTVAALTAAAAAILAPKGGGQYAYPMITVTKSVTILQPVTSVRVLTSGIPVQVAAGRGNSVQVTEAIQLDWKAAGQFDPNAPVPSAAKAAGQADPQAPGLPAVPVAVSGHLLTVNASNCDTDVCAAGFALTVPRGTTVSVSTGGGDVMVSGTAGATVDSGGGNVYAAGLRGPLSAVTENGTLMVSGLAGSLYADTSGGSVDGSGLATATATVITGGGDAWLGFTAAPGTLTASTDGGAALLAVPPGPYALTADSNGADQVIAVATSPAARHSITVTTGGGPLQVEPPSAATLPPLPAFPSLASELPSGKDGFGPVGPVGPVGPPDMPAPPVPPNQ
jgi:hypothetical protein